MCFKLILNTAKVLIPSNLKTLLAQFLSTKVQKKIKIQSESTRVTQETHKFEQYRLYFLYSTSKP